MKKVEVNAKFLKQKPNNIKSEKKDHSMQDFCKTKTSGNTVKNENIPRKPITDINCAIERLDQMLSKTKIFGCNTRPTTTRDTAAVPKCAKTVCKKSPLKNIQYPKTKIDNLKVENAEQVIVNKQKKISDEKKLNLKTNTNTVENSKAKPNTVKFDSTKDEIKKMNQIIERLNEKLKTVTNELSNEKYKRQNLEAEKENELSYKEKLDKALADKYDLLKRLKECEMLLVNADKKMNCICEETDRKVKNYTETFKKIEEGRRNEWNEYHSRLENQNTEYQKALCRKERFIEHLEFNIDSLTQQIQDLQNDKMNIGCTESNSHKSYESEECKNQLEKLSETIANMTCMFETAEASHQLAITEMKNTIKEKDKLIDSLKPKSLLDRPETTFYSTREITAEIDDCSSLDYNCKWL